MQQRQSYWITAENAAALPAVEEGLKLAEASGVHLWDFMLLLQDCMGQGNCKRPRGAEAAACQTPQHP